jgi:EmrB/QacA subfamily drug resistance transporter
VGVAFVFGVFMDILDTTVVNVALPTLAREFDAGDGTIEWVVTGYLLSLAVWIPASGWIGDRFGTKRTFLFALATFTIASMLCGVAWSVDSLIAFRVLQGVGGGMLTPVGGAMLFRAYPPSERAKASAIMAIPAVVAPALGPVLGGLLVTHASWRWIFYVNVPTGIIGFVFAARYLEEHREPRAGAFDATGFVLSGGGLALVLYALARGPSHGWASVGTILPGVVGLAAGVLLVVVELASPAPLLDLRLFGDRMFRQANISMMALTGSMLGILFLLPLFLQNMRGLDALHSGLVTFPQAIGLVIVVRIASRLYPRIGPRRLMLVGAVANTAVTASCVFVGLGTSLWWIRGLLLLRGMGTAPARVAMQVATMATVSPAKLGRASSLSNTDRQVASALCVAILATVLATRTTALTKAVAGQGPGAALEAQVRAFHQSMLVSAAITVLAVASAWFIHDEDAAETMVVRA